MHPPLRLQLDLALYEVAVGEYATLDIRDLCSPHWIISHVRRGRVRTETRGEKGWADDGDVMIHPPHIPFSEIAAGPGAHEYLMFDLSEPPGLDVLALHPVSLVIRLQDAEAFSQIFARLHESRRQPSGPDLDLRAFALTVELVGMVVRDWSRAGLPPRPPSARAAQDRFLDVIAYMSQHLDHKLTRDDLAAHVFLHPGYFDRVFRKCYGVAPLQMVRDLRLARAQQLLEATDDPQEAIAAACGLGDAAAFSRAFRARYGVPPGRFRESARATRQSYLPP